MFLALAVLGLSTVFSLENHCRGNVVTLSLCADVDIHFS